MSEIRLHFIKTLDKHTQMEVVSKILCIHVDVLIPYKVMKVVLSNRILSTHVRSYMEYPEEFILIIRLHCRRNGTLMIVFASESKLENCLESTKHKINVIDM